MAFMGVEAQGKLVSWSNISTNGGGAEQLTVRSCIPESCTRVIYFSGRYTFFYQAFYMPMLGPGNMKAFTLVYFNATRL